MSPWILNWLFCVKVTSKVCRNFLVEQKNEILHNGKFVHWIAILLVCSQILITDMLFSTHFAIEKFSRLENFLVRVLSWFFQNRNPEALEMPRNLVLRTYLDFDIYFSPWLLTDSVQQHLNRNLWNCTRILSWRTEFADLCMRVLLVRLVQNKLLSLRYLKFESHIST